MMADDHIRAAVDGEVAALGLVLGKLAGTAAGRRDAPVPGHYHDVRVALGVLDVLLQGPQVAFVEEGVDDGRRAGHLAEARDGLVGSVDAEVGHAAAIGTGSCIGRTDRGAANECGLDAVLLDHGWPAGFFEVAPTAA